MLKIKNGSMVLENHWSRGQNPEPVLWFVGTTCWGSIYMTLPGWFYLWERGTAQHYLLAMPHMGTLWWRLCQCWAVIMNSLGYQVGYQPHSESIDKHHMYSVNNRSVSSHTSEELDPWESAAIEQLFKKPRTGWDQGGEVRSGSQPKV
jgi:hypothetical protein